MAGFGGAVKLTGESEYRAALKKITQNLKEVASEMKLVSSQYDKNDHSEEALSKQTEVLNKALAEQKKKFDTIKAAYDKFEPQVKKMKDEHAELVKEYEKEKQKLSEIESTLGKSSKEYKDQAKVVLDLSKKVDGSAAANDAAEKKLSDMRVEMNKAQTQANKTAKEIDELGKDTKDAGEKAEKAASGGFTVLKGVVADLAASAIKKALEGLKELGSKLVDIGKQSFGNFAAYEQVVGGVETLFKESAKTVEDYASQAYKTAGISANEYMQQVTSFSATLLQGLDGDTAKAAKYADQAIRDMSDNANKFGSDMSSIQNAYQNFAKQNYVLLDNLRLGYGGSASEMARLINDSGVLGSSIKVTANTVKQIPFSTIIDAIHKVQENLGVTGTTAKEASSTIEGSGKAVKASWENMLTAVAGGKSGAEKATKTLVENVKTYLKNAIPVTKRIVSNLASAAMTALKQYAPGAAKVLEGVVNVVKGLFNFVKGNWRTIVAALAAIAAGLVAFKIANVITSVVSAISGFVSALKWAQTVTAAFSATMAANPFALLAAGIAAVAVGLLTLTSRTKDAESASAAYIKKQDELIAKGKDLAESINDSVDASAKQAASQIANVDYVEKTVLPQLEDLIDANGEVKKGEEERAAFLLGQFNEAMGTEYESIKDLVDQNGKLKDSIYDVIEARKADIYLSAYKDEFEAALGAQNELNDAYAAAALKLSQYRRKYKDYIQDLADRVGVSFDEMERQINDGTGLVGEGFASLNRTYKDLVEAIKEAEDEMNEAADSADKNSRLIQAYSGAMSAAAEGDSAAVITALEGYSNGFKTAASVVDKSVEEQLEILGDQVITSEVYYRLLVEKNKAAFDKMSNTEREAAKEAEKTARKRADAALKEYENVGKNTVKGQVKGVEENGYKLSDEMEKTVSEAVKSARKSAQDFYGVGLSMADGTIGGINDKTAELVQKVKDMAAAAVNGVKKILGIASPSKVTEELGKYFGEGFAIGIDQSAREAQNVARELSQSTVNALRSPKIKSSNSARSENMVDSFKEALAEMKIELDDRVAGKFVERTVARAIY